MKEFMKRKSLILSILGVFVLIVAIGGITFAFFNYTRTGAANTFSVGNISFSSNYENVELNGVFPIAKSAISTDTDNVMTVNVNIEGDTTYAKGIYYEVKADDVHLTVNGKNIPIGISVTSSDLSNVTLTSYEDGKILTNNSVFAEGRILASDPDNDIDNSVDGTVIIKAYIDRSRIAITDTVENGPIAETGYINGTTNEWINGRVVLTTAEWNSLASTPLSFKVKVEAIENDVSTLVDGITFSGKVKKLVNSSFAWSSQDNNITTFERVTEKPDTTGFTDGNVISTIDSAYPIYAWYENGVIKYYSESENIKANKDMTFMFALLTALEDIGDLASLDTTNVTTMQNTFTNCIGLTQLTSLSNWNVSNVTIMQQMFQGTGITSLTPLSNWNVLNVTDMNNMFYNCTGLTSLDGLSNWNVSNVANMFQLFSACTGITSLTALASWNVSNVTSMSSMFSNCTGITSLTPLSNWNVSNVTRMSTMFDGCTGITSLNGLSNWNVSNVTNMQYMFDGCTALSDASGINNWDITGVGANRFTQMFKSAPSHPEFTKVAGTWDANGTFTPSA